jgi:hypothetical protein
MEFSVDQVNLAKVGLARVTRDSWPGEELDAFPIQPGKGVGWAAAHGLNCSTHRFVSPSQGGVAFQAFS